MTRAPLSFGLSLLFFAAFIAFAASGTAWADAVEFTLKNKVLASEGTRPHIALKVNERLDSLFVRLEREDGQKFDHRYQRVEAGGSTRIDIPLTRDGGARHFKAVFEIGVSGETMRHETEFDAEIIHPPQFTVRAEDVNVDGGFLTLAMSRVISRVEVEVFDASGKRLAQRSQSYGILPAGAAAEVLWGPTEGEVFRIALKVHDADGFHFGLELFPWRYDIPHEEVVFASGSAEIAKAERPKIDASIATLREVLRRMGPGANLKLYIAGATDTVGPAAANLKLSAARARAIGRYFRAKGIRIPIFTTGLGEQGLKVATADEVDEVQNRRADYIVAVEPPAFSPGAPPVQWHRVP